MQDATVSAIARVLRPQGEFRFVSDIADYCAWTLAHLARAPELEPFCRAAAAIDALLPREHTSGSAAYEEVTMRAQTLHAALLGREREATRA